VRGFLLKDPSLSLLNNTSSYRNLKRTGSHGANSFGKSSPKVGDLYGTAQYQHAFPLLSHADLGHNDHSNNTHNIMLSMYMPKRNRGTAPWFRGADTYSVKYSEQSRYEYLRYMMINRFPAEYRSQFLKFLGYIAASRKRSSSRQTSASTVVLPQEALHWLLRMIIDNFNPVSTSFANMCF